MIMYTKFTPEEIAQQEKAAKVRRDMIFGGKSPQKNRSPGAESGIDFFGLLGSFGGSYFLWNYKGKAWICNAKNTLQKALIHTVHDYTVGDVLTNDDLITSSAIDPIGKFEYLDGIDFWKVVPDQERPDWVKELFLGKL